MWVVGDKSSYAHQPHKHKKERERERERPTNDQKIKRNFTALTYHVFLSFYFRANSVSRLALYRVLKAIEIKKKVKGFSFFHSPKEETSKIIMGKVFTLAEVSDHNTAKDCWLVIDGKVYDVTKFLEDHPGGEEVLLASTGKDATDDFEDIGHSSSAKAMMDEFYVGAIDVSSIPARKKYTPPKQPLYNQDKTFEFVIKVLQFLVPLLILGLAVTIRFYATKAA